MRRLAALGSWGLWLAVAAAAAAPLRGFAQELEFHAPASPADANVLSVMRDLAERLLPVYQSPTRIATSPIFRRCRWRPGTMGPRISRGNHCAIGAAASIRGGL